MTVSLLTHVSYYLPEFIAIITMCGLLFLESTYSRHEKGRRFVYISGLIGLSVVLILLGFNLKVDPVALFAKSVIIDPFSTSIKIIMVIGTLGTFYLGKKSNDIYPELKSEFLIMSVGVLVGGMLLASANNMLTLYLGVETLSILSYVMTSLKRRDSRSTEAGLKYALYGGVTAGIMLYGISHIYGIFGSIHFGDIVTGIKALESGNLLTAALISFILFFVGIGYKIACFPFHMWSPDVYEGSPVPVTAFFAIVPKLAGLAVVIRITSLFFAAETPMHETWIAFLQVIAAMTMTVGNVSAINQESVKRMLAYSSIGHVGMLLMGVLVMSDFGVNAILFYALVYMLMTLGAFFITSFVVNRYGSDEHTFFKGLIKVHPFLAISYVIILFSLAGLPPFGGFVAKFNIISVAVSNGYYAIAFIAAINSVIALYFYMRLVKYMTLGEPDSLEGFKDYSVVSRVFLIGVTVPVVLLGVFWDNIYRMYSYAKIYLGS